MSLKDCVSQIQCTNEQENYSKDAALLELQRLVGSRFSGAELAEMEATNPRRAQAEVASLCASCFLDTRMAHFTAQEREDLTNALIDSVFGYGPLSDLLKDERVTEIIVNGPSALYYEQGGKLYRSSKTFANKAQLRALIDRIVGPLGRRIDESSPMVNARLPQGHRVNAVIEPLALDGPYLTIRKFSQQLITFDDMCRNGSVDAYQKRFFEWAVAARKNIAVSGGTGSGKTTFLNALSCFISPDERIVTIEDSAELRFSPDAHVARLEARPGNAEGMGEVTIRDLVINALRMRPDRIVVGECRGAEALDMLQAMNTGHDGSLTTLHANSTREAVMRLATMVRYSSDLPIEVVESYIASALDVVVQMARGLDGGRYVSEISQFRFDQSARACVVEQLFTRQPYEHFGKWVAVPSWLDEVPLLGLASQREVEAWKQAVCS